MLNYSSFNSLVDVIKHFSNENSCYSFLKHHRWSNGVVICPYCGSVHISHRKNAKQEYKCQDCGKSFSVLVGTIFENTKLPISKWIIGIYLISSHKNGISSVQLSQDLKITQTSAWHMLHKVRTLMKQDDIVSSGNIEMDEMYLGGRETNKHLNKKIENTQGRSIKTKMPIFGMVQCNYEDGKIHTYARVRRVNDCSADTLGNIIRSNIEVGSNVTTDELLAYKVIFNDETYIHHTVKHKNSEYSNSGYTTNRIEGFWGGFKRMVFATYHMVGKNYLNKYIDESVFRYNTKELTEGNRFELMFDIAFSNKISWENLKMRA